MHQPRSRGHTFANHLPIGNLQHRWGSPRLHGGIDWMRDVKPESKFVPRRIIIGGFAWRTRRICKRQQCFQETIFAAAMEAIAVCCDQRSAFVFFVNKSERCDEAAGACSMKLLSHDRSHHGAGTWKRHSQNGMMDPVQRIVRSAGSLR